MNDSNERNQTTTSDPRVELDVVGAIEGADKSSAIRFSWDYLKHLEPLFAPYRHAPINVMEVGVQSGPSVRLWKWYFSRATIVGIDIDPACAALAQDRVVIEIGSQADPAFMSAVCAAHPPTIFIDDGSHLATHNIQTFEHVFPLVAPGGLYVVEDLAFHFGPHGHRWHGKPPRQAPDYFLDLARSRLARRVVSGTERPRQDIFALIDSVHFIDSAVIARRAYPSRDLERARASGQAYLAGTAPSPHRFLGYARYLIQHGLDLSEAASACQAALDLAGPSVDGLLLLADIKERQGERDAVRSLLVEAADLADRSTDLRLELGIRLARAQARAGLVAEAIARLEALQATRPNDPSIRSNLDWARKVPTTN